MDHIFNTKSEIERIRGCCLERVNLNRRLDFLDWDNNQERMRPIIKRYVFDFIQQVKRRRRSSSSFIVLYLANNT
ncbi:hypothetical protein BpHYR1_049943 [Brachionus plicatilis]|uniref:Uncharacterized protein n=1 Tax=Brachionus plicatilis TaxID=10195 RepID=A0A3M7RWM4_BRAPC|nr:hypothetical protein BpHYR1_049943 [Brachionus plicatilis]